MVCSSPPFRPAVTTASTQAARAALDAGRIGEVRMAQLCVDGYQLSRRPGNWRARPDQGGVFLDVGEHAFDLVRWLVGSDISTIHARIANFGGVPYPEPSAMAQLEFANGAIGQAWITFEVPWPGLPAVPAESCSSARPASSTSTPTGSRGFGGPPSSDGRRPSTSTRPTSATRTWDPGVTWERLAAEEPGDWSVVARDDPRRLGKFAAQLQEIVDALARAAWPWPTQGRDGVLAIAAVEACRRSAATGMPEAVRVGSPGEPVTPPVSA